MTWPLVQFVSSPDPDADVRYDFNAEWSTDETWPAHDGFSLGAPALLGDPDGINPQDGLRKLSFNQIVRGTHTAATARVSALALELRRARNWLRVQLSEFSEPVYFHTYRSESGALDFTLVMSTDDATVNHWGVGVSLDADPLAEGHDITLWSGTINNDPAAASNPLLVTLPAVRGDASAPVRVHVTQASNTTGVSGRTSLLSVFATEATWPTAPILASTTTLVSADASNLSGDTALSGGDGVRVDFSSTAGFTKRFTAAASSVPSGRYRILARVRVPSTGAFTIRQVPTAATVTLAGMSLVGGDTVTIPQPAATTLQYVDLGTVTHPFGGMVYDGEFLAQSQSLSVDIWESRTSGSGALDVDFVLLVPFDGPDEAGGAVAKVTWGAGPSGTVAYEGWMDGCTLPASARLADPSSGSLAPGACTVDGVFPCVRPGFANVLHFLREFTPKTSDDITKTATVTLTYRPRWLHLAGA